MQYKDWTHEFREALPRMALSELIAIVVKTAASDDCGDGLRCSWAQAEIDRRFPVAPAEVAPAEASSAPQPAPRYLRLLLADDGDDVRCGSWCPQMRDRDFGVCGAGFSPRLPIGMRPQPYSTHASERTAWLRDDACRAAEAAAKGRT